MANAPVRNETDAEVYANKDAVLILLIEGDSEEEALVIKPSNSVSGSCIM